MQVESESGAIPGTNTGAQAALAEPTAIARLVPNDTLREFAGVRTPAHFAGAAQELAALTGGCGVYDLGCLTRLRITGADRVRWLNGMVTNTVKDLATGRLNYTFLLNAQGRIQGDGEVYALADALLFVTDREQAPKIAAHLDRFIIMDEVELMADASSTALGLAGSEAEALLTKLELAPESMTGNSFGTYGNVLTAKDEAGHFTLWASPQELAGLWERLVAGGAAPCGLEAVESLRVLEGRPRYGADIHEKSLAQETGQMRALNFNKGCYLGQEIVERIRSRATVHRGLQCFVLDGPAPAPGTPIFADGSADVAAGMLTSITTVEPAASTTAPGGIFALGTVREEAAGALLRYEGGVARVLDKPPLPIRKS